MGVSHEYVSMDSFSEDVREEKRAGQSWWIMDRGESTTE
jgi:hypothetical protein